MVVDAALYMYFVGLGVAGGVATVFFISLAIYNKMKNKPVKKRKGALNNGVTKF